MNQSKKDLLVMKFLHYFITEQNYNPVIVHGVQDEIWLENMNNEFKIIRLVTGYIHNDEQLKFDDLKVQKLTKQIKRKTFTFRMKVLSFYLDINDDINITDNKINSHVKVKTEKSLNKNEVINKYFSDMISKLKFTEEGEKLFEKINNDILKKNITENEKINELFKPKKPIVTYILLGIITLFMILMYILGNGSEDIETLYNFGALVKNNDYYRLITSMFLHIGIIHFIMNFYALKILGEQVERFYGHIKTFIIFMVSGIIGNLFSLIFMSNKVISAGASGAIFGLMGALLYFSINQRTYMAEALKKEIIPVIIINMFLSVMVKSINLYAHVGGLIGGILIATAVGIKYKTSKFERTNGVISTLILTLLLTYLVYIK